MASLDATVVLVQRPNRSATPSWSNAPGLSFCQVRTPAGSDGPSILHRSHQPPIDSKNAGGRKHHLCGDQARCPSLDTKRHPKPVGHEEQDKPPTRKFVVERQEQRTGHAGCAA